MTDRDPRCVIVVEEHTTAVALAEFLTAKGFPSEVVQGGQLGKTDDSLGFSETQSPGLEVRVTDPAKAGDARKLLTEHAEAVQIARAAAQRRAERTGTVTATCEECGKSSDWPAAEMGTTQDCPFCGAYMDIPDPEESWDEAEFEGDGESDEKEPADGK
jgi:hypothetical protein